MSYIFRLIHKPIFNHLCCNRKYPWGWMPKEYIKHLINKKENYTIYENFDTYFYEPEFCEGSIQAYKSVLDLYKNNGNFLSVQYATPSLSIAINSLLKNKFRSTNFAPEIIDVKILDTWVEEGIVYSNEKILGLWNSNEFKDEFINGIVGPEMSDMWFPKKYKQIVKVLFISRNRKDVWLFEKCLIENSNWNITNINEIIIR